jgi:glycosyltransferase involved in cell wall biosynthesis
MHVCFLNMPIEYYSPVSGGAVATILMETARELQTAGHQVTVLTATNADPVYPVGTVVPIRNCNRDNLNFLQRRIAAAQRRLHHWDWPYYGHYKSAFTAALRRLSPAPDAIILFNDLVSAKYLRKILRRAKILVWLQNEQRTNQPDISQTVAATDAFLTCSQYIKDFTCATHGISPSKVVVAHSGVDLAAFRLADDFPSRRDRLRALFVGRIDPNKGPDLAVDAVAALRAEGIAVNLTVAGGVWFYGNGKEMRDPFFRKLKTKMDSVSTTYLGHVSRPDLPPIVRRHDVALVLSRSNEPFGLVALEAMASGCAVIASNRGGLPEACGGAAILVNPDDLGAIVGHLRRLATDPAELRMWKMRSVARAAKSPWSATADVVHKALGDAAAAMPFPAPYPLHSGESAGVRGDA